MELRRWIQDQHSGLRMLVKTNILAQVPAERLAEQPALGRNSIAWIIWHITRCQDVAVNAILRQTPQVLAQKGWSDRLGLQLRDIGTSMDDDEIAGFSAAVRIDALTAYWEAVCEKTRAWLKEFDPAILETTPDVDALLSRDPDTLLPGASWVAGTWRGGPAAFFLGWLALGHSYMHLGEMMAIRGELGIKGL